MKKLVFLVAIIFAISMTYAQTTTSVTQSGNYNTANVNQDLSNPNAPLRPTSIYAVQSGSYNVLNADQLGTANYISLNQSGYSNSATMNQLTLAATTYGYTNNADITQSGTYNSANLTQKQDPGTDYSTNTANATQSGNNNSYTLAQGLPHAGTVYSPINNQYLTQSGDYNYASLAQGGKTQYSEIKQTSTAYGNYAELFQKGQSGQSSSWDKSYSWQNGTSNDIMINQIGSPSGGEFGTTYQNGDYNHTGVTQNSWSLQNVTSQQHGNHNTLDVNQNN
jgi:hypothetical protein